MVSTRPQPSPVRGRIHYPAADSYAPGDAGAPPTTAAAAPPASGGTPIQITPPLPTAPLPATTTDRRGSGSSSDAVIVNPSNPGGGQPSGLSRLRSMRDRARGREPQPRRASPTSGAAGASADRRSSTQRDASHERELSDREKSMQGLKTWWKAFSSGQRPATTTTPTTTPSFRAAPRTMNTLRVFGLPLAKVLDHAAMQISTSAPDGSLFVWGQVPIVVAKCGAYLKNKTDIEGLFRVSGSAKRMRELQGIFDEGPVFGADIEWDATNFSPHDVATIFRRFLTQMPEPVIPVAFYNHFRNVQTSTDLTPEMMVREYKRLIRKMPKPNQYLLLYVLDLLGIVDKDSEHNLMNAANLAVIFQPGLLSHPGHHMHPKEIALSKDVVEFLISHQHQFVVAMSMSMSSPSASAARRGSGQQLEQTRKGSTEPTTTTATAVVSGGAAVTAAAALAVPHAGAEAPKQASTEPATTPTPPAPSPTSLAIPAVIPEHGQPELHPTPSPGLVSSIPSSRAMSPLFRPPAPVRADSDFMLPSDSDDDAPSGGYYIVEAARSEGAPISPDMTGVSPKSQPTPLSESAPPAPGTTSATFSLIAPPRPPRSAKRGRPSLPNLPSHGAVPAIDVMDPSDSDDDTPSGGYMMYENKRPASARPASVSPIPPSTAPTGARRTAFQPADARTNSPKPPQGATGLLRRRTLPTKRVSDFTARMRRAVREA